MHPRQPPAGEPRGRLRLPEARRPRPRTLAIVGAALGLLAAAIAIFVYLWDWNFLRGPLGRYASDRTGREVAITGDLEVDIFTWSPSVTAHGLTIGDPAWRDGGKGRTAEVDGVTVQVRLMPLLRGNVLLERLHLVQPNVDLYRDDQGRATWDFRRRDAEPSREPFRMPPVRSFIIDDGTLRVRDERRDFTFNGTINARERMGADNRGFELSGEGTMNQAPFKALITGGPLINIQPNRTYPFDADIRSGATHVTARGGIPQPFNLGRFHMDATARGDDLADLYFLTGLALPNTPPYQLKGRLERDRFDYRLSDVSGRVGDSDLAGNARVDTEPDRPFLRGEFSSRRLDFDDLGAIFGGAPKTGGGETASATQRAVAGAMAARGRLFPDAPLRVERIRAMDADVTYRAAAIVDAPMRLSSGEVRLRLDNGLLRADPLTLELPQGRITGNVALNARRDVPVTELDLRLANARVEHFLPASIAERAGLDGALVGRARLRGAGDSVHKAMANADGDVTLVVPNGTIREAFAELTGINLIRGLGLLFSEDMRETPIRCGVAHFNARGGVLNARQIVVDTGPVVITGSGSVNLATEQMGFRIQGHPKELRLVRVLAPITLQGPIRSPRPGVEPGAAVAQGGFAVALGALISPLAAILPFVDPGLAEDANCAALIGGAQASGAPVRSAGR